MNLKTDLNNHENIHSNKVEFNFSAELVKVGALSNQDLSLKCQHTVFKLKLRFVVD